METLYLTSAKEHARHEETFLEITKKDLRIVIPDDLLLELVEQAILAMKRRAFELEQTANGERGLSRKLHGRGEMKMRYLCDNCGIRFRTWLWATKCPACGCIFITRLGRGKIEKEGV